MMHGNMDSQVVAIQVWPLQIPLRRPFKHAAAERSVADPIVVEVELANGTIGYGETLARPYVTGETPATVQAALGSVLLEALVDARPQSMSEVLELAESLPWKDRDGRACPAARAALELALLDAYSRFFQRDILQLSGWFGVPGFGPPGSTGRVRYGIVLGSDEPASPAPDPPGPAVRHPRLQAQDGRCRRRPRPRPPRGGPEGSRRRPRPRKVTLRIDANGAWQPDAAMDILSRLKGLPIAAVEQPTPRGTEETWRRPAPRPAACRSWPMSRW